MKPSRLVAIKTDAFTGDMVVVVSWSWPFGSCGCDRRDSNPHGLPHRILSPARLPVPPRSRDCCASTYAVGHRRDTGVWASVAFPPLRAAFSPCPASAGGSRFPRMMVTAVNWARLKVDGPYRLRRGAWYAVRAGANDEVLVHVSGKWVRVPWAAGEVAGSLPTRWAVVRRAA